MNKNLIREYYDKTPEDIMACMDDGDLDTFKEYLNTMKEAHSEKVVSSHTVNMRMIELNQYAKVKHGSKIAVILDETTNYFNQQY